MNKIMHAVFVGMIAVAGSSVYAADEPGRSGDPASAEKPQTAKEPAHTGATQKSGRDCPSGAGTGTDVHCPNPDAAAAEPGRSGDPASAEKQR